VVVHGPTNPCARGTSGAPLDRPVRAAAFSRATQIAGRPSASRSSFRASSGLLLTIRRPSGCGAPAEPKSWRRRKLAKTGSSRYSEKSDAADRASSLARGRLRLLPLRVAPPLAVPPRFLSLDPA
jgi:hypothetical protein